MKTQLFISCIAVSALFISACSTQQTNKPPPGNGYTGPVSSGQGGGAANGGSNTHGAGTGSSANNGGRGNGSSNNQTGSGAVNGLSSGLGSNASGNSSNQTNNGGFGNGGFGSSGGANGTGQGGFGSGSAYGGNTKGAYTPADLRDPDSILAQRIIYFDYDQAGIKPEYRNILDAHGALLADFPRLNVRLEGHADERGSREYNVALSERRAISVLDYLKIKGVRADQADVVGYGEEVPATFGRGESSWSKNRRVEIIYAGE